jgi:hypothetical protein
MLIGCDKRQDNPRPAKRTSPVINQPIAPPAGSFFGGPAGSLGGGSLGCYPVGVGNAESSQNRLFPAFHGSGLAIGLMVIALSVQHAVNN